LIDYLLAIAVFAGLYALMALGLNLIWGLAGMINLGLAGFYAIGAYACALLAVRLHWPMPACWAAGALLSAALGAVVAVITARLRGDYLAIVTLGFAEVIRLIATNELWLTNGTDGISSIPGPWRSVVTPHSFNLICDILVWGAVAILAWLLARLSASPFGRVLRAIREDEVVASVAGKSTLTFKVQAFALGAAVLGLAGGLFASVNAYVAPDSFTPLVTLYIVLALTAGGTGRMAGAVLGGVLVVALTESTRFLGAVLPGLQPVQIAAVREGTIGVALIVALHLRPQGFLPERPPHYAPSKRIPEEA
jgi:branched-chain amino acid transport system permease protein